MNELSPNPTTAAAEARAWPACSIAEAHALLTAPGAPFELELIEHAGGAVQAWKNGPKSLSNIYELARITGDRLYVVYEDDRASYDAFARAAYAFALALIERGVRRGDRVALCLRNLPEWPVAFYGAAISGAVATPLNAWWSAAELDYGLRDSGATLALFDAQRLERIAPRLAELPELRHVLVTRWTGEPTMPAPSVERLEDIIGPVASWGSLPAAGPSPVAVSPEDNATIFYTSGTTGGPKGALASHRAATTAAGVNGLAQARAFLRRGETIPAPNLDAPQRRVLLSVPFFHVTGCFSTLNSATASGAALILMHRFDPVEAMRLIERERVTSAGGVPTVAWQIIDHPDRERYDLSSLESMYYGGAPAAAELVRRLRADLPTSHVGSGWGMTETCSTFTNHVGEDYEHHPESCGVAAPVGEMKVVDPDGATLPTDSVGELCVRGAHVVGGYWNKPEATAKAFRNGWLHTGDLARIDDEGFCFIVDRIKDVIIRGGENIYSVEVEDVLYTHPSVMDCAVVPLAHRTLGEEPAAAVSLRAGTTATPEELRQWVAERLAAFKTPVRMVLLNEPLPRNVNGKIMKPAVKAMFE